LRANPILVTALNPVIGYEKGAAIAKKAYAEGRAVLDVATEMTGLSRAQLERLLDPMALTQGGIQGAGPSGTASPVLRGRRSCGVARFCGIVGSFGVVRPVMDPLFDKAHIREALAPGPSGPEDDMQWLVGATPDVLNRVRAALPAARIPAAVLVPLVEREAGLTVLLTQRATTLKDHAGQISFPGGRIEPDDADAWRAALREAHEEIGLTENFVEFAGYLPDHWVGTGYRVTPAVGFVNPAYELRIATSEVHDVFEVPLNFILDEANHKPRERNLGGVIFQVYDIPYGDRNIWGATAGMLLTLRRQLQARAGGRPRSP